MPRDGRRTLAHATRCSLLAALVLAAAMLFGGADAQPAGAPASSQPAIGQPVQIDRNGVLILIRTTLLAVDQANRTGNYTVLRDLGAPGFQAANTAARLGEIFANLRGQNLDVSGVAVLEPQLTLLPTTGPNGQMRMAGFFPSVPLQINFELIYLPVEGRWRLFGIGLNLGQASPAAPNGPDSPAPGSRPADPATEAGRPPPEAGRPPSKAPPPRRAAPSDAR